MIFTPPYTRIGVLLGAIAALALAIVMGVESYDILRDWGAPVVSGQVVSRVLVPDRIRRRTDFTIRIDGTTTEVHAHPPKYLLNLIPTSVKFHYTGDPSRTVFLFEHDEKPWWICLVMVALSSFLAWVRIGGRGTRGIWKGLHWDEGLRHIRRMHKTKTPPLSERGCRDLRSS